MNISIGVHIFQFDHTQPDSVAVNVYCIEDENFEELKVRPASHLLYLLMHVPSSLD